MTKNLTHKHDASNAEKILEKWSAELVDKNKDKDHLFENFDELFFELQRYDVSQEIAYEILREAVTRHLPNKYILNRTYKASPSSKTLTEKEFFDNWKNLIKSKALEAFYDNYPMERVGEEKSSKVNASDLPSGMSKEEYSKQKRYAMQFPVINTDLISDSKSRDFEKDDILGELEWLK